MMTSSAGVLLLLLLSSAACRVLRRTIGRSPITNMLGRASIRTFDGHPVPAPVLLHPHTDFAHRYWENALQQGDTVVDATAGNGHDAAFLARALGRVGGGQLVCIDVQRMALERSQVRVRTALEEDGWDVANSGADDGWDVWRAIHRSGGKEVLVRWQLGCHATLLELVEPRSVRLVVFNLGYLPGGSKAICTRQASTVAALNAAQRAIAVGEAPLHRISVHPAAFAVFIALVGLTSSVTSRTQGAV